MCEGDNKRLNLYDYFGFPDRQQRDEVKQIFDRSKLNLISVEGSLFILDTCFEQYNGWSNHINNYSSSLDLHFLLMHYQYRQKPSDSIGEAAFQSSQTAHKIFFDTFAEDVSLYLVSYLDKHLEMFNDLYDLKYRSGKKYNLRRKAIINEMEKIDELQKLAGEYQIVIESREFKQIKKVRDNFVHNKSSSHTGMSITKIKSSAVYSFVNSKGISTEATYEAICKLLKRYEKLCEKVNEFVKAVVKQEEVECDK